MDIDQKVMQLEDDLALQLDSGEEFSDHKDEPQLVDDLGSLVCNSEDLLTDSQLVEVVATPTQVPEGFPATEAEIQLALQLKPFSWAEDMDSKIPPFKTGSGNV